MKKKMERIKGLSDVLQEYYRSVGEVEEADKLNQRIQQYYEYGLDFHHSKLLENLVTLSCIFKSVLGSDLATLNPYHRKWYEM